MNRKADGRLQDEVQHKLMAQGIRPPCRVTVSARNGVVTLTGTVQHAYQKKAAVRVCHSVSGVQRVIDNIPAPGFQNVWSSREEWEPKKREADPIQTSADDTPGETERNSEASSG